MKLLESGQTVELRDNPWNSYIVLTADKKYAEIRCLSFVRIEDLGDGLKCYKIGDNFWIAQYHANRFNLAKY